MADSTKFNMKLSKQQRSCINNMLPKCYSLQIDTEAQRIKQIPKTAPLKKIQIFEDQVKPSLKVIDTKRRKIKSLQTIEVPERKNLLGKRDEIQKKWNLIKKLKKHQSSWPFRNPVNSKALEIPNYHEIILTPMDLQTVQEKLKNDCYQHPSEFERDINQILMNSYKFNYKNESYFQATIVFERYYIQLTKESESNEKNKKQLPERHKKKEENYHVLKEDEKFPELSSIQKDICGVIKMMHEGPRRKQKTNHSYSVRYSRHENAMNIKEKRQLAQQIKLINDKSQTIQILRIIRKYLKNSSHIAQKKITLDASSSKILEQIEEANELIEEVEGSQELVSVDLEKLDVKALLQIQSYLKMIKNKNYRDFSKEDRQESYLDGNSHIQHSHQSIGNQDYPLNK